MRGTLDYLEAKLLAFLSRIETKLNELAKKQVVKDFYSIKEVAELLEKDVFTVREWARRGRVRAQKKLSGRGRAQEWVISNEELSRIQREGLLPRGNKSSA